jgi:hypothetical protein
VFRFWNFNLIYFSVVNPSVYLFYSLAGPRGFGKLVGYSLPFRFGKNDTVEAFGVVFF